MKYTDRISKSRLLTYKACPRRFYLLYMSGKVEETEISFPSLRGKKFHEQAHDFFEAIDLKELEKLYRFENVVEYMQYAAPTQEFAEFEARRYFYYRVTGDIDNYIPVVLEEDIWSMHTEYGDLHGIVDRLDLYNRNPCLVEYKPKLGVSTKLEVAYYKLVCDSCLELEHIPEITWGGVFQYGLDETQQPFAFWRISQRSIDAVINTIHKLRDEIEWPKTSACFLCPAEVALLCYEEA